MDISEDWGNYNLYTTGQYYCSCAMGMAGYGGGMYGAADTGESWTPYTLDSWYSDGTSKHCLFQACNLGTCAPGAFEQSISLGQTCVPGYYRKYFFKRFLGVVYSCANTVNEVLGSPPC